MIRRSLFGGRPTDAPPGDRFLRGLIVGSLVGAAIAGSTIWERRRARRNGDPNQPEPLPSPRDAVEPDVADRS